MNKLNWVGNIFLLALFIPTVSTGNQFKSYSIFHPTAGSTAHIFFANNQLMVQFVGDSPRPVTRMNNTFIEQYPNQLYKIIDSDKNGTLEIASLRMIDKKQSRLCYDIFQINVQSRQYHKSRQQGFCVHSQPIGGYRMASHP